MPSQNGSSDSISHSVMKLLTSMLSTNWDGQHTCSIGDSPLMAACSFCEFTTLWFQLSTRLIRFFTPDFESPTPVQDLPAFDNETDKMNASNGMHLFFS